MNNEHYLIEMRRGTILIIVLSILHNEYYGYSLLTELNKHNYDIDSNTLYPLLRRLEKQQILSCRQQTSEGRIRKYYVITEEGKKLYKLLIDNYNETDKIIKEVIKNG